MTHRSPETSRDLRKKKGGKLKAFVCCMSLGTMTGKESHRNALDPALSRSRHDILNKCSLPYVITSSVLAPLPSYSAMTSFAPSYKLRKHLMWTLPEGGHKKMVEIADLSKLFPSATPRSSRGTERNMRPQTRPEVAERNEHQSAQRVNLMPSVTPNNSSYNHRTVAQSSKHSSSIHDSQKSTFTSEFPAATSSTVNSKDQDKTEDKEEELTEEEMERQHNIKKCLDWLEQLPAKFSGMHILHEQPPSILD